MKKPLALLPFLIAGGFLGLIAMFTGHSVQRGEGGVFSPPRAKEPRPLPPRVAPISPSQLFLRRIMHEEDPSYLEGQKALIEWLQADQTAAIAYLTTTDYPPEWVPWLYGGLEVYLASFEPRDALTLLRSNPFDPSQVIDLMDPLLAKWAYEDESAARQWLMAQDEWEHSTQAWALMGTLSGGKFAPKELKWISTLESKEAKAAALSAAYEALSARGLDLVADLINAQAPTTELDEAIYTLSAKIARESAPIAMTWATSIQEEPLQRSAVLEVAARWSQTDPSGYGQWKAQALLPSALLAELPAE